MYKIYRIISPYLKAVTRNLGLSSGACRYSPTCSQYAKDSFTKHGIIIGGWWTLLRVLKCNPWSRGGYDPIHK